MLDHRVEPAEKKSQGNAERHFRFPMYGLTKDEGISRTRSVPRARNIVSKTILKPLVCGASSNNRERPMAKKPHMES